MKSIVMFFGVESDRRDPVNFKGKREAYLDLGRSIRSHGFSLYICKGYNNYQLGNSYACDWLFDGDEFVRIDREVVQPYRVLDRSGKLFFPGYSQANVVNNNHFKHLTNDKWLSYQAYPQYFPKSYIVTRHTDVGPLVENLLHKNDRYIVKPTNSLKGKGVDLYTSDQDYPIFDFDSFDAYLLQEYKDTSGGVEGLVEGMHDIRVVLVNREIIWSHVRTPSEGQFKANVAQGGGITEIDLEKIPQSIVNITKHIAEDFFNQFDNPLFSIDFGLGRDGDPFIFEFNDQIGFPQDVMESRKLFATKLADRLCL